MNADTMTFGQGALAIARIRLEMPRGADLERAARVARATLDAAGIPAEAVLPLDDAVSFDLDVVPEKAAAVAASLGAWRGRANTAAPWLADTPPATLPALADALSLPAGRASAGSPLSGATASVHVAAGAGVATDDLAAIRQLLAAALGDDEPADAPRPQTAETSEPRGLPRGRRWATLPIDTGVALVRHHRIVEEPRDERQEIARTVATSAFGGWIDSILASQLRETGLSYSPEARIVRRAGFLVAIVEALVEPGLEAAADAAIGRSLRAASAVDATAALARSAALSVIEGESLRGRLAQAHREDARARRWPGATRTADVDLLAALDARDVEQEMAALYAADEFDALVLSPREALEEWEDL